MLLHFKVKNFLSFRDLNTFSLMRGNGSELLENTYEAEDVIVPANMRKNFGVLKSAFLYGGNGAGKTNLLKAMSIVRNMIVHSGAATPNLPILVDEIGAPFLFSDHTPEEPSEFEVMFELENTVYTYSVSLNKTSVITEKLCKYAKGEKRVTEKLLFERTGGEIEIHSFDDKESAPRVLHNSLALSKFAHENSEEALIIHRFFSDLHVLENTSETDFLGMFQQYGDEFKDFVVTIFQNAKLGIQDIEYAIEENVSLPDDIRALLQQLNKQPLDPNMKSIRANISTKHSVYDKNDRIVGSVNLDIKRESRGVNKLLKLAGSLFDVIKNGKILFFDEIESTLHPNLTRNLVQSLHTVKSDKKFQFVFTTHDPSLLDIELIRRDQIWFAKRDKHGASTIKPLIDFDITRKDISIAKLYRNNAYNLVENIQDSLIPDID